MSEDYDQNWQMKLLLIKMIALAHTVSQFFIILYNNNNNNRLYFQRVTHLANIYLLNSLICFASIYHIFYDHLSLTEPCKSYILDIP